MRTEEVSFGAPFVSYIHGAAEHISGDEERGIELLKQAVGEFEAVHLSLNAAATKRHLAALIGGDEGKDLLEQSNQTMAKEAIVNPERISALLAPGFRI